MDQTLKGMGWIFIIIGIIGGGYVLSQIDYTSYKIASEVFSELSTNEFAEAKYVAAKTIFMSQLTFGISIIAGGIISGLSFLGFGTIIELLQKLVGKTEESTLNKAI